METAHHSLIKKNKIHHRIALVILLEFTIEDGLQRYHIRNAHVGRAATFTAERCEYHWLLEHIRLFGWATEESQCAVTSGGGGLSQANMIRRGYKGNVWRMALVSLHFGDSSAVRYAYHLIGSNN